MIEKIILEVNIPMQSSLICNASLKFEIRASPQTIKDFNEVIAAQIEKEK